MTAPDRLWVYRARLVRVIDGDTVDVYLDSGFHGYRTERLRLLGINAPEMRAPTYEAGMAATMWVRDWFSHSSFPNALWPLLILTEKTDSFGRYLAEIWRVEDGACLNADIVASGHAVPMMRA